MVTASTTPEATTRAAPIVVKQEQYPLYTVEFFSRDSPCR